MENKKSFIQSHWFFVKCCKLLDLRSKYLSYHNEKKNKYVKKNGNVDDVTNTLSFFERDDEEEEEKECTNVFGEPNV